MFKIQYPTNHLKKEGVNSKIAGLLDQIQYKEQVKEFPQFKRYRRSDVNSESESRFEKINVPGDNSCLFWSVTMAYLIPVRNNDALFRQRYEVLFGNKGAVIQNLDRIRNLVKNLSTANYDDTFANLVRNVFRNRVVDYIRDHENEFRNFVEGELSFKDYLENMRKLNTWGGEPEIRAMSEVLEATISVSGVTNTQYGKGDTRIQLFHVALSENGGTRNHYNYGLEQSIYKDYLYEALQNNLKKYSNKKQPSGNIPIGSTFVEATIDNQNYEIWLQQEDIANIARIEYGWYGENSDVVFEVVGSVEQLNVQLDRQLQQIGTPSNKKSLTFIINLNNNHWVTLVITNQNGQLSAYYVDSLGDNLPNGIKDTLRAGVNIKDFGVVQQYDSYNCGIFALENARIINHALQNNLSIQDELSAYNTNEDNLCEKRKEFARALRTREIIESKIEICLKILEKLNGQKILKKFNYKHANIFLIFLETFALQDPVLQELESPDKYQKRLTTQGIIDQQDMSLIQFIRSNERDNENNIFHPKKLRIISPSDIQSLIKDNIQIENFFPELTKYVTQVYKKLKGEVHNQNDIKQPKSLLKDASEIKKMQLGKVIDEGKAKEEIANFFEKAVIEGYKDTQDLKSAEETMFKFTANIIPLMDKVCKVLPKSLAETKRFRGDLIHKFYEFLDNTQLRNLALKEFISNLKYDSFRYYYSQKVFDVLRKIQPFNRVETISDRVETISDRLKKSLALFQDRFGEEYLDAKEKIDKENPFEFVASELVYSKIDGRDDLEMCVNEYFKLMSILDNEDKIKQRETKRKGIQTPQRYRELTGRDRREIYEDFRGLKEIFRMTKKGISGSNDGYEKEKNLLKKKFKGPYGILKDDFDAIVEFYVENPEDNGNEEVNKILKIALTTLGEIKKKHPELSNQEIIDRYNGRKDIKGNKGSIEEKFYSIPEGKTIDISVKNKNKAKVVQINTDKFVQNIFEMFNNAYIRYRLVFNNIEAAFSDETFLDFLSNKNVNIDANLLQELLAIDYLTPYIAKLLMKEKLTEIIGSDGFKKVIGKLLEEPSYTHHLSKLLEINDKTLKKILKLNANNIKTALYEEICNKIIEDNIDINNLKFILREPKHLDGILSSLVKKMGSNFTEVQTIVKKIVVLLNRIADELYNEGEYEKVLDLLEQKIGKRKNARNLIPTLTKNALLEANDLELLRIRRNIARAKNKKGEYQRALDNFNDIKDKILHVVKGSEELLHTIRRMEDIESDKLYLFLLISSDIAYTHHSLKEYREAYNKYEDLYKSLIRVVLDDGNLSYTFNQQTYDRVIQSEKYKSILELSPKYLNILKIRSDMAHELGYLASSKEKQLQNEALKDYEKALKIYEEVYEIKEIYSVPSQDIVKNMRDIAYVNNKLAQLKLSSSKLSEALSHYDKVLEMYSRVLRIQEKEQWETHPANSKTIQDIIQAMHNVAYVNNRLGSSKSSNNPEEALEHHTKALEIYEEVYKFQKSSLGEEHEYTLKTIENVAFTHNKLARLKSSNNPEEALQHYEEAEGNYREVYNIKLRLFGEEYERTKSTKNELDKTGKWKKDLLEKHPQLTLLSLPFSSEECLSDQGNRKKREAKVGECLFTWEDVDEFNTEKDEKRDFSKIKIDSEKFVDYIKDLPKEKSSQLIQLADKVKVIGESQSLVSRLIGNQKVINHLSRVGKISGMTMHGMMAKNILADFLNGNYQGVAINVGFIAGGQGFAKVAEAASLKGLKLAEEGKALLGSSLKAASPFLARGTSAFVVYDLVNQVKAFKNGTEEALVGIVGDSIYLGVDAAEIGIEIAEAFEVLEGVSSVTGPIGTAIGAVVFVGTDVYMAVKRVDKIDQIIHLKGNERFIEGLRAFIGMEPEKHIEELIEEKQLNNQLVKQGLEYLQQHSDIQRYVFPTGKSVVDSCNKVQQSKRVCVSPGFNGCTRARTVTSYTEKCTTKFEEDLDNTVLLDRRRTDIKWSRAKPDNPRGGQLFCLPQGNYEPVPNDGSYLCKNAIGLSTNKTGNHTLINLGKGEDYAQGFTDSPNIFVVNDGLKGYYGGNKDDVFILQGDLVRGYLSGGDGIDTLDLTGFAQGAVGVDVYLNENTGDIIHGYHILRMDGMERVLGRKAKSERIFSTCDTQFLDGQGGAENNSDIIVINNNDCTYKMQIIVRSNTNINNNARNGDFNYNVLPGKGKAQINLSSLLSGASANRHNFFFNYTISELVGINIQNISQVFNYTVKSATFSFLPTINKSEGAFDSKLEERFNVTISDIPANASYVVSNGAEIKMGSKGNLYMLENTNKSVDEIIRDYLVVANRLDKMSFFIQSLLSNETVAIGSGNYEVIHNNPLHKSHLVGNGGENVYVIDSEGKRFEIDRLPIPEVVIYDLDVESSVDTIDLRNLVKQARSEFSNSFELQVLKSANDLLLKATVTEIKPTEDPSVNKIIKHEYFTVRLKDGINWYNKTHVIMDNVPMKINLDNNEWSLKPLPLKFEKDKEVIIVTSQDVEENTGLITPKKAGNYTFVRDNGSDLMITNAFDASITKDDLCTITLSKFYEKPKMATLSIKFADKEIILKEHQEEISTARDVNVVKKEHKDQVYNGVFNHTKSSPEVIMLSDQPVTHRHRHSRHREQTRHRRSTSSGIRPTGWINDLFGWVRSSISGLLSSKPESTPSSISQVDARVDVNGTIMLLDVFIRKVTGQKYISTVDQPISPLEAQGYALNITGKFEKVVEQAALKSGISMHRLNIDFVEIQKEVTGKIMSGKFNEISEVLSSYVKRACPGREAGKLSLKKFDKFMVEFNSGLNVVLNQPIQQILHNENSTLRVSDEQINSGPQSYLSNTSIQGHLTQARDLSLN